MVRHRTTTDRWVAEPWLHWVDDSNDDYDSQATESHFNSCCGGPSCHI